MKILIARKDVYKSPIIEVQSELIPIWSIGLSMWALVDTTIMVISNCPYHHRADFNDSLVIKFKLFSCSKIFTWSRKLLLGHTMNVISDIFGSSCSSSFACVTATQLVFRYNSPPFQLCIFLSDMHLQDLLVQWSQTGCKRPCQGNHQTWDITSESWEIA